ncbi:class I SAM-dependent methyltransferase, partial [Thioclava sp. BHET1]
MSREDLDRWNARFGASDAFVFGEDPNRFLVECAAYLPAAGRVLAVADGEGRNGVWLAGRGLDVLSLDFSPTAQAKARGLAERRGVTLRFEEGDVHDWPYPEAAFDLVVEIFTQFSPPEARARKWAGMQR